MAQYKYKAQNAKGNRISGTMQAADETELHQRLREEGLMLLTARVVGTKKKRKQFRADVLSDFGRQLSTLLASGVTLVRALGIIAKGESVKPKEKEVYDNMLALIRKGFALSDAMEEQNGAFPPLMIHMFRSAENSGNIDDVAMKMAVLYEKEHRLNAKISSSMTYPKILSVMVLGVVIVLTQCVMPQFKDVFGEIGSMPASTRILMKLSDLLKSYWYLFLAGAAGIYAGVRALLMVSSVREAGSRLLLSIPVLGNLQKTICTARFARTLSSLYSAGIPVLQALQIARKTTGSDYIDRQFDTVISFMRAGNNLSDAIEQVDGFVKKLSDIIRIGEETGSLDSMLSSTAESMEYDSDVAINKIVSYIEPVMLLIMGIIVAVVISGVFGAVYGSYDSIGGL